MELFPLGIWQYLTGGILIGISVAYMYWQAGYISGASQILSGFVSFCSNIVSAKFRGLRIMYFTGIVLGALLFALLTQNFWVTNVPYWRLIIGGLLVGFGTTMGKGCTSGHGICGLASFSKSSLIFVTIFFIVAILTALLVGSFV